MFILGDVEVNNRGCCLLKHSV